jgi:D-methionine transport system substrate-binding protein
MKRSKTLLIALLTFVLTASLFLPAQAEKLEKIVIGGTPTPHNIILSQIVDDLKAEGFDLEIREFTEYPIPNPATAAGDIDANFFQHGPYLSAYNNSVPEKDRLVGAIAVHYEPYGLYAGTKKSLDDLADGDHIAITNDPSNETRALLLLQDAGIIKLKEGITFESSATPLDIVENVKNIVIEEMDAELIPAALPDVAYAVINGNYAIGAGLSLNDALFIESTEGESANYANFIVVRTEDAEADFVKALRKVLFTQKIKDFILNYEDFKGGVVPVFEVIE